MTTLGDVSSAKVTSDSTKVTSEMTPEEKLRQWQDRVAMRVQAYFMRFLFLFQGVTQLYVTLYYLIDFAFMSLSPLARSALKLWAWHLCLVGTVNWLCLLYYRNDYNPAKHRPDIATSDNREQTLAPNHSKGDHYSGNNNPNTTSDGPNISSSNTYDSNTSARDNTHSNTTSSTSDDTSDSDQSDDVITTPAHLSSQESSEGRPLPWTYCKRCQMATPPRTRHCKKCEVCVIRRDHHCELVGLCVGHRNQRFFVVLANYGNFVCYIGAYMTLTYLYHHHPEDLSLWNYVLPITFYQGLRGNVSGLHVLLTYHAYMLVIFCPLCTVYFLSEMSVILQGKTMREVMKKMKHIKVSSSLKDKLRVVFGDHWWLSFLFPTHFFLPQQHNGMDFTDVTVEDPLSGSEQKPVDKKQE